MKSRNIHQDDIPKMIESAGKLRRATVIMQKAGRTRLSWAHGLNARAFSRDCAMLQETRPRVLLADDHVNVLTELQRMLEPSCEVVGQVTNGAALLEAVTRLMPDVIVLDIAMPELNGLDACREIKATMPQINVVVLTAFDDPEIRQRALSIGASAYVPKHMMVDDLLIAIQKAHRGGARAAIRDCDIILEISDSLGLREMVSPRWVGTRTSKHLQLAVFRTDAPCVPTGRAFCGATYTGVSRKSVTHSDDTQSRIASSSLAEIPATRVDIQSVQTIDGTRWARLLRNSSSRRVYGEVRSMRKRL